ncbi:MAG: hypothetical protein AAGH88_04815 [Planctomycetota bacterium]
MLKIILPMFTATSIIVVLVIVFAVKPKGDPPTSATSTENLKKQTLPADLPKLAFTPKRSGQDGPGFDKVSTQCQTAGRYIGQGGYVRESQAEAVKLMEVIEQFSQSRTPQRGFADRFMNGRDLYDPELKQNLEIVVSALNLHVKAMIEEGKYDSAQEAAGACFALGHALFNDNTRLMPRRTGLLLMRVSLQNYINAANAERAAGRMDADAYQLAKSSTQPWFDAILAIETVWAKKLESINNPKPNVGDLVRVADKDEDLSFRVFAVRRLGLARFERGDSSNQSAINSAIESALSNDQPMIREAAESAQSLTVEQFRKVNR